MVCKFGENQLFFFQGKLVPGGEGGWEPDLGFQETTNIKSL